MRWCIEYIPAGSKLWQHAYCDTEQEAFDGVDYLESIGCTVTEVFELDY